MPIADRAFKRLSLENVNRSPKKRGVYALYEEKTLVFLGHAAGESDTIRHRLRSHLGPKLPEGTCYKRELSDRPAERLKALLKEHVASHGCLPAQNAAGA